MTTPHNLPILSKLDEAIENACEYGDLKFNLSNSYGYNPLTNFLSLSFLSCVPSLEGLVDFSRKNIGRIIFDPRVEPIHGANFYLDGMEYKTSARTVLIVAKNMLEIVALYETIAKVSIHGTDYFNSFKIPRMPKLEAPITYHTDHELSQQWKAQVMSFGK